MKRTTPLKQDPAKTREWLQASRGRRKKRPSLDREAGERWGIEGKPWLCQVCGEHCGTIQGHHVLYQAWVRDAARTLGLDYETLRWDRRLRLWTGDECHRLHHSALRRIPLSVLREHCPEVFDFAAALGLSSRLERCYPERMTNEEAA